MEQLNSSDLETYLKCIDYTVSKEEYTLYHNTELDILITKPVPKNLESYYESKDYISHTDNKTTLFDKLYQFVKDINLNNKLKLINSLTKNKTVLDVGAGTGDFLKYCKTGSWSVSGIEPSAQARELAIGKGILLKENIEEVENQKFDIITLWHVLEHIPNLKEYIRTLKSLLKDDGTLIIAVPNFKSYDAEYYKEFWAAYDVPRHLWHFSKKGVISIFSSIDMKVEKTLPMRFDSYYVCLLSEKYKHKKQKPVKAFFRGFISNWKARKTKEYSSLIYIIKK